MTNHEMLNLLILQAVNKAYLLSGEEKAKWIETLTHLYAAEKSTPRECGVFK